MVVQRAHCQGCNGCRRACKRRGNPARTSCPSDGRSVTLSLRFAVAEGAGHGDCILG